MKLLDFKSVSTMLHDTGDFYLAVSLHNAKELVRPRKVRPQSTLISLIVIVAKVVAF